MGCGAGLHFVFSIGFGKSIYSVVGHEFGVDALRPVLVVEMQALHMHSEAQVASFYAAWRMETIHGEQGS